MIYYDSDQMRGKRFSSRELDAIMTEGNDITLSQLIHNPYIPDHIRDHLVRSVSLSRLEEWVSASFSLNGIKLCHETEGVILQRCAETIATELPVQCRSVAVEKHAAERIEINIAERSESPSTLRRLVKHKHWYVRYYVATNPNTPLDMWSKMMKDRSKAVREAVEERSLKSDVIDLLGCVD